MGKKGFHLKYDPDTDILHVAFGQARRAISLEKEPEVFVRVDPKTHEIVGLTVLGFRQNFLKKKQEISYTPPLSA